MDTIASAAHSAPASSLRTNLRFTGSGSEYFKIWIVNLALTIMTLGLFSAWAKVRSRRYLYGNTFIGEHSFDYHAQPLRILLGRAIAAAFLLAYSLSVRLAPATAIVWVPLFFVAMPWMVKSSLRFNARNTSYRNIRFDFVGTYGGALKAFVLWWLLAAVTLFTTLPLAHRARDHYNINNHRFGGKAFAAQIPGGKLYAIYGIALAMIIGAIFLIAVPIGIAAAGAKGSNMVRLTSIIEIAAIAGYLAVFLIVSVYLGTATFNLALNSTRLDGNIQLELTLSPVRMIWIAVSNLVLVLITLGLMFPWARIRSTRYLADHIALVGAANMDDFTGTMTSAQGVIGEEVASFFDIDLGL